MELNKINQSDYLDIVFDGRNQAYGAYDLRKGYQKTVKRAIILGGMLFLGLLLVPFYAFTNKTEGEATNCFPVKFNTIPPPPVEKVKKPDLPKVEIPQKEELPVVVQPVKTQEFKVPKVVEDNLATKTPPKIADFEDAVAAQTPNKTGESGSAAPTIIAPTKGEAAVAKPIIAEATSNDKEIFTFTEIRAEFPGGERALLQWLANSIKYPAMAREANVQGKVFLSFVVEKNGDITDIKVRRGIGSGCDEAAKAAVAQMPKWSPAKQNGRAVRVQFTLPVDFHLD